jgi:NAD(P)H-dependent FMN reductase
MSKKGGNMATILIVTGSVRPQSVNSKVVPLIKEKVEQAGRDVVVADLGVLDLPFFNDAHAPSQDEFAPTDERVLEWTDMVRKADGVVFVMPEYNHTMSPVQLNAIDWIFKEWAEKPVALIGYGWTSGAAQSQATAREALAVNLKANVGETTTNLFFMKDIGPDGSILDQAAFDEKTTATLEELYAATK